MAYFFGFSVTVWHTPMAGSGPGFIEVLIDPNTESSVADPYVFGPTGYGSGFSSQRYGSDPDPSIIKQKY
jgi:hypothetical protein